MDGLWDELCEVVTGFRTALGGAQEYFGIVPDMVTFAKCISNGFALGAVVGKPEIMKVALDSFISSVYWAEATGWRPARPKSRSTGPDRSARSSGKSVGASSRAWGRPRGVPPGVVNVGTVSKRKKN